MKANELMIGDWFQTTYPNGKVDFRKVEGVMQNHIVCNNGVTNAFEPIPLTAEILEKNGFKWLGAWYIQGEDMGIRNDGINGWGLINLYGKYESMAFCHIYYVHELQHALRLCGLNNLADNILL